MVTLLPLPTAFKWQQLVHKYIKSTILSMYSCMQCMNVLYVCMDMLMPVATMRQTVADIGEIFDFIFE